MASTAQIAAEAKEFNLVEKLEFRIANSRTDEQLSELLAKFLAPLLLKLESQYPRVKEKTLRLAQHIQTRLASQ
jgi:proteasome component ECM29